jgi:2-polyprenyl-3-methyl-5-hydroxy-6-metoxy-1,4-benzoquinol methylase
MTDYTKPNKRIPGFQITEKWGMDARQKAIAEFIPPHVNSVMDWGCADGSFLILLYKQKPFNYAYGLDLWKDGINWGNNYVIHNLRHPGTFPPIILFQGSLENYDGPETDVGVIAEVLEHLADPVAVLKIIRQKNKRLIITVPIAAPKGESLLSEEHLTAYTPDVLNKHCLEAGWTIKVTQTVTMRKEETMGWVNLIGVAV